MPRPPWIRAVLLVGATVAVTVPAGTAAPAESAPAPHQAHFEYVSPWPGARFTASGTSLIFRPRPGLGADWPARLSFRGEDTGPVRGAWIVSDDAVTRIFRPDLPFAPGETVTVSFAPPDGAGWSYAFRIAARVPDRMPDFVEQEIPARIPAGRPDTGSPAEGFARGASPFPLPADLPAATVTRWDAPMPGTIFLSNLARQGTSASPYLMILGNDGLPRFFRRMSGNCLDFKLQPTGVLSYFLRTTSRFYLMDRTYTVVDSVSGGNGVWPDGHELRLLPDGHAVVMIYEPQTVDMSGVVPGGQPDASVVGVMLQELDSSRNVVFQWSSFDWMDFTDAADDVDLTASHIDWTHANAIDVEDNGDFLLSCRNTDDITRIRRATGEVAWRFGGKKNRFTFANETRGFSHQHAIRRLPNGNVILFDNGNGIGDTRAVEYRLDEENLVATTVWEYHHDPPLDSQFMGFAQRLRDGTTFISWGTGGPLFTEVAPDGRVALEMELPPGTFSYRTLRHHWEGDAAAPTLWSVDEGRRLPTLVFTRFGEKTSNRFHVYGGTSPAPTVLVGSTEGHTFVPPSLGSLMYFRVTEVERNGAEGPYSNEIAVLLAPPDRGEAEVPESDRGGFAAGLRNAPNPFAASTEIAATLPPGEAATVRIFNVLGQEVRTLRLPAAASGRVEWDGRDARGRPAPAGVYLYRLETSEGLETRRMVRVR